MNNLTPEQLKRNLVVYVAGPYRDKSNWEIHRNIFVAETLAFAVWEAGMSALSPHLNTAHFQYALPDDVWLQGDLAMLVRCDAMICTMGWERSNGTRAEVAFCRAHDIPVFFTLNGLHLWAEGRVKERMELSLRDTQPKAKQN